MAAGLTDPDWKRWHAEYDVPGSRLERRLTVVRQLLSDALDAARPGRVRLLSACAGEGRDVLGVLVRHPRAADVTALLVEADPDIAAGTERRAQQLGLGHVSVSVADAGTTSSYLSIVPADIALFCGVFGNISPADVANTISNMRCLLAPNARVLWTRGRDLTTDPTGTIRRWFESAGFAEEVFVAPADEAYLSGQSSFTVGMHRLDTPADYSADVRLFDFIGYRNVRRLHGA